METLDTIEKVLFPINDLASRSLLISLTSESKQNFDTDILYPELSTELSDQIMPADIPYGYFGDRLAALYKIQQNPPATGLEEWVERKSKDRHIMMATIAGVCFALFFGIAALALAGVQTWLAYQQWQHPIKQ